MNSIEKIVVANSDRWKPKSIELDLPQILSAFARLKVKGQLRNWFLHLFNTQTFMLPLVWPAGE